MAASLALNYGVFTKVIDYLNDIDEIFGISVEEATKFIDLVEGDNIIITGGFKSNETGNAPIPTNLMKIHTI